MKDAEEKRRATHLNRKPYKAPALKSLPKLRLLMFTADWCGPCQAIKKKGVLEKFAAAHPNVAIVYVDLDTKKGDAMATAYNVESIPALFLELAKGQESCAKVEGFLHDPAGEQIRPGKEIFKICRPKCLGQLYASNLKALESEYREALAKWDGGK